MSPPWQELLSPLFRTSRTKSRKKPPQSTSQPVAAFAKTVWRRPGSRAFLLSQHTTSHPQSQTLSQTFGMEGKQRDTSNKQPLLSRQTPRIPSNSSCHAPSRRTPPQSTPSPLHRQTMLYWSHWKARTPSGGCLPNSTGLGRNTGSGR